ncbi:PREDICTED: uncharacterized protein F54H12.2-like [Vollenhovia emeryi]|uniref:uncharacterized protein F54H12.2-like n=1 Tax=Vollenhovia emeryi TaxID=411798 RepID=UPI0005F3A13B|nr:PREDICTED: uncharacterized protein F54H12.2-like [Vollenhovia emeryi]
MSFLHTHSSECLKSELDLFSLPPTQTSIENSQWIYYKPVTSLADDTPIEFVIPDHGEDYLDLTHTMLSLRIRVDSSPLAGGGGVAGTAGTVEYKAGPVNHLLHSMFNQIDVYFNQKLVSPPNNAYAYRAYIEALLNYSSPAKTSHLTASLWEADTPGLMDALLDSTTPNQALVKRSSFIQNDHALDLLGHLHCDVFNQDKFLINGVEVRMRLVRSKDSFCLMESNSLSKIHILDASLLVRRAKIRPGVLLAHARMLSKTTAKYHLTRVEVRTFTIHAGLVGESIDNVILGQLPKRIIVGFVDNRAFNGDRKLNPFNFKNYGINFFSLYVDGMQIPSRPLQPNFSKDEPLYVEAYHTLFSGTGIHFLNEGNSINREDYAEGYTLFAFDLTPDLSANCAGHWNLVKHGSLRLEVRFEKPPTTTINCIVYAEFDNMLEIDSSRQIIVDFAG